MDVLLATTGSAGDVYPFLALGKALRLRDHRVSIFAPPEFDDHCRRAGLEFVPLESGRRLIRPVVAKVVRSVIHPLTSDWCKIARASTVVPLLRPLYEAIARRARPAQSVVVASAPLLGARIAHDRLRVPLVTVHLSAAALRSACDAPAQPASWLSSWIAHLSKRAKYRLLDALILDPILAEPVNRLRAELGLPGVRRIFHEWRNSPQAVIGLFPDWFARPAPDCPATLRLTGFLFNDCGNMADLSPEVDAFLSAGPPPIVCTPGSATRSAHSFFEESIRACVQLKRRGLLFTPHGEQIPACLPPGIRHFHYAPFGRVLKRACALIHTGGIGTAAQALAAAIPQIALGRHV